MFLLLTVYPIILFSSTLDNVFIDRVSTTYRPVLPLRPPNCPISYDRDLVPAQACLDGRSRRFGRLLSMAPVDHENTVEAIKLLVAVVGAVDLKLADAPEEAWETQRRGEIRAPFHRLE